MNKIKKLIEKYYLQKHPEGGYYAETYRSEMTLQSPVNCEVRNVVTDIYFLLSNGEISRFHKVIHDEIWNFYEGDPLKIITFNGTEIFEYCIGSNAADGYKFVVRGGLWQAAKSTGEYSLVGCTVAPGFDFEDFVFMSEHAKLAKKIKTEFSDFQNLI